MKSNGRQRRRPRRRRDVEIKKYIRPGFFSSYVYKSTHEMVGAIQWPKSLILVDFELSETF